ncbi:Ribosomal RNA small subunit methyltransferase E [Desulfovibrio sp. X2]|uniref:16S rRNA (uracil(1498)-N(3))-methyltransferase n=1 Tax=Desulfovibrio sp. X2 TaxID=941449 RepID=UPI000358CDC2|nr:16S rRNA (uracil(1498)-N(3))-methyltransferase [Desulfovibrio sp. X2]EPR42312.1 Ribosomal RNA small subunit methyltransferase E [Desulfovibrio sp. X2]
MGRLDGFYLPPEQWGAPFILTGGEARHLLLVLRAAPGTRVRLFDGQGHEGVFRLVEAKKDRARLEPEELRDVPPPGDGLTLAVGFSKSARRDWLLEKAVELGAAGLVFWQAQHSQGRVPDAPKDSWRDKLVSAAKQCGSAWLPTLSVLPGGVRELSELGKSFDDRVLLWENETRAAFDPAELKGSCLAVVGPEGGLTDAEAEALCAAGFAARHLGHSVLRLETAALLTLGLAYHHRTLELQRGRE